MDMDYEPYMLVEGRKAMENPPSQSLHQKLLAEAFNMNGRRILASKNKPPTLVVEDPIPLFSSSSSTSFHPSRPVKPQRHIPQARDCSRLFWIFCFLFFKKKINIITLF
jgi:cell division cycle protein 20 (cofactor of APC complex)